MATITKQKRKPADIVIDQVFDNIGVHRIIAEAKKRGINLAYESEKDDSEQLTFTVTLVPHGYQIDAKNSNGEEIGSECRDFGGDYPPADMATTIVASFLKAMERAEFYFERARRFADSPEDEQDAMIARSKLVRRYILTALTDLADRKVTPSLHKLVERVRIEIKGHVPHNRMPTSKEIEEEVTILVHMGAVFTSGNQYTL